MQEKHDNYVLENAALHVEFDARGQLCSLRNRLTGSELIHGSPGNLWRLFYPGDCAAETPIDGGSQTQVVMTGDEHHLVMVYPAVTDCFGVRLNVRVRVEATLSEGDELTLSLSVENHSSATICECWFPLIAPLRPHAQNPADDFLLYPESAGRMIRDPLRNLADREAQPIRGVRPLFLRDLYPGRAATQWLGLYGPTAGLYLGSHDSSLQSTAVQAMLLPGESPADDALSLGFIKYPFSEPGTPTWQSAPFVLAIHDGTWHRDARRYRRFVDGWQCRLRTKPAWIRRMPGLHDLILLHQHGTVNLTYDQVSQLTAATVRAGMDVIKLTGWADGGHDNAYPDFEPSDILGGPEKLREAIKAAQQAGCRVVLYYHFVQMSPNSRFYREHGEFCSLKTPEGNPHIDIFTWPGLGSIRQMNEQMQLINACAGAEPWRDHVLGCVRRGLDLGVDAIFLDQTAGAPGAFLCFDDRHGHASPALACGPGKTRLSADARSIVTHSGGERALAAEYIADCILQHYDFTIPFGAGFFPGGQNFGDLYRFTFPEDIICSQYISREDYHQLHYSFLMAYRFFLAPRQQCDLLTDLDERFVDRLRNLVGLYRQYADVLLEGTFLSTEPLLGITPGLEARAFAGETRRAATLWNPTCDRLPIAVLWGSDHPHTITRPGEREVTFTPQSRLNPDDVAIVTWPLA